MRDEETKKDKVRNLTVANWVFALTTHVVGMLGGLQALVINFKFHQNRLSGYRVVHGGRNLAHLGLYNSLNPRTGVMSIFGGSYAEHD